MLNRYVASSLFVVMTTSSIAFADISGMISTDRFGYTGVVKRYGTLADAQAGSNSTSEYSIGNRDLSLYIKDGIVVVMGSWWYTIVDNTNGYAKDDPAGDRLYSGYGNTRGNSGRGFVQLYDGDASTVTSADMSFGGDRKSVV